MGPTSHGHHGAEATAGHPGEQERMRLYPPRCSDFSLQNHQPESGSAVGLPGLGSSHLRTGVEVGDKKGAGGGSVRCDGVPQRLCSEEAPGSFLQRCGIH